MIGKITGETVIGKVICMEDAGIILAKHRFPCIHCPMAKMEMDKLKIGQVCEMYGIDQKPLLKDLNALVSKNGKNKPGQAKSTH